jgi:hypothetical protein
VRRHVNCFAFGKVIAMQVPNRELKRPRRYRYAGAPADAVNLILFVLLLLVMAAAGIVVWLAPYLPVVSHLHP